MNIDSKEYGVLEICRTKDEALRAIQNFETKIATRDHSKDGETDEYDKAFTK
jgi:hypothetical protein